MRILRATYRLQFNEHFRLPDALALVPYFAALGVSHIYASPLFKARAHSVHGYDVCDFSQLNPEIGTETDLENFVDALREREMGLVFDIVPNHMGIGTAENFWWWDVLKNGRASKYANYFDINWKSNDEKLRGKILIPILGDDYEKVLERGELKIEKANGELVLSYFENKFPLTPNSSGAGVLPVNFIAERTHAQAAMLDELIQKQNYRLANWCEGDEKLNYRRFFAVSALAAVRVEDEKVFNDVHALLRKWIEHGWIDGLRVDHPDGLREPKKYLDQLRALAPDKWIVVEKILQPEEEIPKDWPVQGTIGYDFLNQVNGLFIESKNKSALVDFYSEFTGEPTDAGQTVQEKKILVLKTLFTTEVNRLVETLMQIASKHPTCQKFSREQWRDALIEFTASFPVYRTYIQPEENFVGENDFRNIKKAAIKAKELRADLPSELFEFLSGLLLLSFRGDKSSADVPPAKLTGETPVLRFGELENEFILRFQQLTSPVMAKGAEDTAFYCLNWFASINEVGGDPGKFGVSASEFHKFCQTQQAHWLASMLCSSTHDTKRSEDVRAQMNVLSEIPERWRKTVLRWSKMNGRHRKNDFPDRNMEYLFYQTLAGAWPISAERIYAYMEKASCEAKQHTDWIKRNAEYDAALKYFVEATLADKDFTDDLAQFVSSLAEAAQIVSLSQTLIKLTAPGVPDIYQGNEIWDFSLVDPDNRRLVDYEIRKRLLAETKNLSAEEIWKHRDSGLPKLWLIQKTLALRKRNREAFDGNYEPLFPNGKNAEQIVAFMRGENVIAVVHRFPLTPAFSQGERENRIQPVGKSSTAVISRGNENSMRDESLFPLLSGEGQAEGNQNTKLKLPPGNWRDEFSGDNFGGEIFVANLFNKFPVALLVKGDE